MYVSNEEKMRKKKLAKIQLEEWAEDPLFCVCRCSALLFCPFSLFFFVVVREKGG